MTSALRRYLVIVAGVGTATSAVFCGLAVVAALRFYRRRAKADPSAPAPAPARPVSLLKPLHGAEPELRANLETFFQQTYTGPYEVIFCARHDDDAGLAVAREVAARHPHVPVQMLTCGEPQFPNPKMYSLAVMAKAAAFPRLMPSDADCRVHPEYIQQCMQSFAQEHRVNGRPVVLAFSLYRGTVDQGGLFAHLDAAGKSVEMASGVLIADLLSGTDFALGVSMALETSAFETAGGYQDLGSYWAEDFVLGQRLAQAGRGVEVSTCVVEITVADVGAWKSFRDQLRWMQSTRRSRPLGHLGTGLTFAMPFALLGCGAAMAQGRSGLAGLFLFAGLLNRWVQALVLLKALGERRRLLLYTTLYPLRDLLGFAVWVCSYLPADTSYHGTRFRIMPNGRLEAEPAPGYSLTSS